MLLFPKRILQFFSWTWVDRGKMLLLIEPTKTSHTKINHHTIAIINSPVRKAYNVLPLNSSCLLSWLAVATD